MAVLAVRLVAGGKEGGGGSEGDLFEVVGGFLGEVEEVFADYAGDAVDRAVYFCDLWEFAGFEDDACECLVDNGGGTASLGDKNFADESHHLYLLLVMLFSMRDRNDLCPAGLVWHFRCAHILPEPPAGESGTETVPSVPDCETVLLIFAAVRCLPANLRVIALILAA